MNDSFLFGESSEARLRFFARMRYFALASQVSLSFAVMLVWRAPLPWHWLALPWAVGLASNAWLSRAKHQNGDALVGAFVVLDTLLLTLLLGLTGGASNPFAVLYVVHVALAAVLTSSMWSWVVFACSTAGFALLYRFSLPLPEELGGMHSAHMPKSAYAAHLQGMWLAYTATSFVIAVGVNELTSALKREREHKEKTARLLGLASLAAGAAHELGTPLGTIRLAAEDLERSLEDAFGTDDERTQDARLIVQETVRAKQVLTQLGASAGELEGETPTATPVLEVLQRAVARVPAGPVSIALDVEADVAQVIVHWPTEAVVQAMSQLLRNAVQASRAGQEVELGARVGADKTVALAISDQGSGIAQATLARLGEPFVSTRSDGMGLGVFVAKSLFERMGGSMHIESEQGIGTRVEIVLPEILPPR